MIKIHDLYKSFDEKQVLNGVNLEIPERKITAIIGRSGSGKSVLLKLILGLSHPDHGSIFVNGEDITTLKEKEVYRVRKKFGMLFQSAALFDSMTCAENIGLGLKEHTRLTADEIQKIVAEKLHMTGLPGVEDLKPSELSGGMRKRVGLARALAMNPEIILYDEPTTGLDPIMADVIDHLICDVNSLLHVTSIVVTHDMNTVYKVADKVAMLYEGRIHFDGAPEGLKESNDPVVQQFIQGSAKGPIKAGIFKLSG